MVSNCPSLSVDHHRKLLHSILLTMRCFSISCKNTSICSSSNNKSIKVTKDGSNIAGQISLILIASKQTTEMITKTLCCASFCITWWEKGAMYDVYLSNQPDMSTVNWLLEVPAFLVSNWAVTMTLKVTATQAKDQAGSHNRPFIAPPTLSCGNIHVSHRYNVMSIDMDNVLLHTQRNPQSSINMVTNGNS